MISETFVKSSAAEKRVAKLQELLAQVSGSSELGANVAQSQSRARAILSELAIPSSKDEEWRNTDLSSLLDINFQLAPPAAVDVFALADSELAETANSRLVFVNGIYAPELSSVTGLPAGVYVGNLAGSNLPPEISTYLAQQQGSEEVFTALNTAGLTDAAVVWVPANTIIETPIQMVFLTTALSNPVRSQPRALVVAQRGSACTIIEEYAAARGTWCAQEATSPYFTNAVTEIWLAENAQVKHDRIQREATNAIHISKTAVSQAKDSRYTCTAVTSGAKLSRHNLEIFQTGEGTETVLNGLAGISNSQLADTHSAVMLNHPHGIVRQLHKCIADANAHAVFNGKIFVAKAAQLTDASQLNRNLLLSRKAKVDTKPQLEIIADNVKCSHGATVSQLEPQEMFYLQSRGLDPATSRNLLIDGFAGEILSHLSLPALGAKLSRCIACRTDM
ncbi:MAG: Fe-S cluster assembly protein SufD [Oscillatoriaceae cyanobacterium]